MESQKGRVWGREKFVSGHKAFGEPLCPPATDRREDELEPLGSCSGGRAVLEGVRVRKVLKTECRSGEEIEKESLG